MPAFPSLLRLIDRNLHVSAEILLLQRKSVSLHSLRRFEKGYWACTEPSQIPDFNKRRLQEEGPYKVSRHSSLPAKFSN